MKRNILFASLFFALFFGFTMHSRLVAQEAWPGIPPNATVQWVGYLYANNTPVQDPTMDVGKNDNAWDLVFVNPGAIYTVQAASSSTTAFFRIQVRSLAALNGPGTYYIFIGDAQNVQLGMVYLTIAGNNTWTIAVKSSTTDQVVASNVNGFTRVSQTGVGSTAFVDFQAPLATINSILGINANTPIKFYSGTSTGTGNIGNINLDYMTSGNVIDFTSLAIATFTGLSYGALPVELTSFTAHVKEGTTQLKWRTATELDNYGFEIQRSMKKDSWEVVGFVQGHGTSNSPRSYSYEDRLPNGASGQISYRLRQIDRDGTEEYSPLVMVRLNATVSFGIADAFPNPFNPSTTLSLNLTEDAAVSVRLHDVTGRAVLTVLDNSALSAGSHSVMLNAADLPSGRYMAVMTTGTQHSVYPVLLSK